MQICRSMDLTGSHWPGRFIRQSLSSNIRNRVKLNFRVQLAYGIPSISEG
jgi:hypothetical protein